MKLMEKNLDLASTTEENFVLRLRLNTKEAEECEAGNGIAQDDVGKASLPWVRKMTVVNNER